MTADQVGWLKCLVSSYDTEHDWDADEDQDATLEMLAACRAAVARPALRVVP